MGKLQLSGDQKNSRVVKKDCAHDHHQQVVYTVILTGMDLLVLENGLRALIIRVKGRRKKYSSEKTKSRSGPI